MAQSRSMINSEISTWTWVLSKDGNHHKREAKDTRDRNQDKRNNANVSGAKSKGTSGPIVESQRTNYRRNHPGNNQLDNNNRKLATTVKVPDTLQISVNVHAVNAKEYTD